MYPTLLKSVTGINSRWTHLWVSIQICLNLTLLQIQLTESKGARIRWCTEVWVQFKVWFWFLTTIQVSNGSGGKSNFSFNCWTFAVTLRKGWDHWNGWMDEIHKPSNFQCQSRQRNGKKKKRSYIFNSRSVHINANSMNYGSGHVWLVVNLIGPLPGPLAVCF